MKEERVNREIKPRDQAIGFNEGLAASAIDLNAPKLLKPKTT